MHSMLVQYATKLMNRLINELEVNSFCKDGLCYYTRCENEDCRVSYCKFNILTNEEKCSPMLPQISNVENNAIPFLKDKLRLKEVVLNKMLRH